jgi:hypothetical protein
MTKPGATPEDSGHSKMDGCPSSARSAVDMACGQAVTAEDAENAEKAGPPNGSPGLMLRRATTPEDSRRWGLPLLRALCGRDHLRTGSHRRERRQRRQRRVTEPHPRSHDVVWNDAWDSEPSETGSRPSSARSARSAVEIFRSSHRRTAGTAEDAEGAERAGLLSNTPTPHDETWNDA